MKLKEEEYLAHYGILRRSGRYPWGSGGTQSARNKSFLDIVQAHRKVDGWSDSQIAQAYGLTTTQLRALKSIALAEQKQMKVNMVQRLADKGMSNVKIGERLGMNESSVRALLAEGAAKNADQLQNISSMLKREVDKKDFLDVGIGVERSLVLGDNVASESGVSKEKFQTAVAMLKEQGYQVHTVRVKQQGTGEYTTHKVLVKPGVTQKEAWMNRYDIKQIQEKTDDGGDNFTGLRPPTSMSSRRIKVNYAEDGGDKADGVMYIRPGAKGLDMGQARYAQVRIMVDGTHYLKGMAVYKDDLPEGTDIVFNTNKKRGTPLKDKDEDASQVLKPTNKGPDGKTDMENPWGAAIKMGGQRGHLNIVNEEGADWDTWSRNLPSQMLSKQRPELVKQQLAVTREARRKEFDEIKALENPTIKKKLLETFAEETDSAAVHLKAAAMPNQATRVLLPINSVKPHEIYAPQFRDGERVALVRFPHGGTFEIPELTVNNKNAEARKMFGPGGAKDAVGIHHTVAERLSGADFDGDTVLVIPNNKGQIKSTPPLEGLKGFDPKKSYPKYDGMVPIDAVKGRDQREMGYITNLIADMTIKGASPQELARAVRHSMVVIDAKKHQLDYKSSHRDNGIPALKAKYQGSARSGASTLVTRAGAEVRVEKRKPRPASEGGPIDPRTGEKKTVPSGQMRKDRHGNLVPVTVKSKRLAETDDARDLIKGPGTRVERIYADHSNELKALANDVRKEVLRTPKLERSPSAAKIYHRQVQSLDAKLNTALKNAPLERQAQVIAGRIVQQKVRNRPDMEKEERRKIENQALAEARSRTGAGKKRIDIEPDEWDAIQAGAISNKKLTDILNNADLDKVRKLATPRHTQLMTSAKTARAKAMLAGGFTQRQVADALGVSLTTLKEGLV